MDDFLLQFTPSWGYRDIEVALQTYAEAEKSDVELADAIKEYKESLDVKSLDDIDVCYVAFDTLYQEARSDIEAVTGKDICNEKPFDSVNVHGNYMCTQLDAKTEAFDALAALIDTIPVAKRSPAVKWLRAEVSTQ